MNDFPDASSNSGPLLAAAGLTKSYTMGKRSIEVLREVNISVDSGEFLVLCGPSGSGKSTLLHLLGGLDLPNAGEITFRGKSLHRLSTNGLTEFRNRHVGFVFQAYHLLPELSALENVCLPARISRTPASAAESRARDLLGRVGLGQRLDHRPYELSGGEQQRVAIARSLINEPSLILADEPTGNLDSQTGAEIIDLLRALQRESGRTLIMATHDTKVAELAPRMLRLVDGRIA